MKTSVAIVAAIGLASRTYAQLASSCDSSNEICFKLNIPDATASSNSGDIYFQLTGPTSKSWVALGQGSAMKGANMFVMYASANGQNVTVSPRLGTGHVMPQHDTAAQITLLEGSGISNGVMTANVRCANCASWSGGSMDFTQNSASWIYASKSGDSLASDDLTESIQQHDANNVFTWDFSAAKGGSSLNPFVTAASTSSTNSSSSASSSPSSVNTGSPSIISPSGATSGPSDGFIAAHGSLASVAFVALFPLGAILIRLATFSSVVWVHAAIQILAYIVQIAAAGMGIYIALSEDLLTSTHPIIGLVLLGVVFFQPFSGYFHHLIFRKRASRSALTHVHMWIGRAAILLGIINGGLGLQLAQETTGKIIAYSVFAAIVGLVYIVAIVVGERQRKKRGFSNTTGLEKAASYNQAGHGEGVKGAHVSASEHLS